MVIGCMNSAKMVEQARMAHWAQFISDCKASGLGVKAYCEGHGVKKSAYYYWFKKLRDEVSMNRKTISPHTFRHTVALNLLQSGVDISTIAIWLGHESILTTHKYMTADMEMKRRTLEKLQEPSENPYHFQPNDALLTFLDSL